MTIEPWQCTLICKELCSCVIWWHSSVRSPAPLTQQNLFLSTGGWRPLQGLSACDPPLTLQSSFNFHPLPHTYFAAIFMGAIDFFQALTFFTAVFPILLPNQSCHLCDLLFPPCCQEFLRKLNNHADWLCYNLMISRVSWTQSCSAEGLLIPTWQVLPFHTSAAPSTPALSAHSHPHHLHSPHWSPPSIENFQVISCERYPVPPLCPCIYLILCSFARHCSPWENLDCFVPENLLALCFTLAKIEHHYIFLPYAIISPGNNTNESL